MSRTVHFLLVDDDDVDVMGVRRAFQKLRLLNPIHVARDGVDALARLRDPQDPLPRPLVLLLDLNMPRMGGLELLGELRKDPALADLPVVVLTTSAEASDRAAAARYGVTGYRVKSVVSQDILAILEQLDTYWRVVELP